eukprot:CAMPEP_0174262146 /NCGR_PEP_ID=MMETSP0439-20130205/12801_1 /TAXON_ID=0 /ORGANISM="Stereomyxa ramosa, Strain Chinc5" /LENGTH=241 /DNA_ID=CAMNT_0015346799 /DNA_START=80 /DNA_END=802 /DNA_ORIENTATION=+
MGSCLSTPKSKKAPQVVLLKKKPLTNDATTGKPEVEAKKALDTKRKQEPRKISFHQKKLEKVFQDYCSAEDDWVIDPSGMLKFCKDLEVQPEDVVMLVLAYKLEAEEMGFFTKDEFIKGFTKMEVDTLPKIKEKVSSLPLLLDDEAEFRKIYLYAFQFFKDEEQRYLEKEVATAVLELLLTPRFKLAEEFVEFFSQSETYRSINKDQWSCLLTFCKDVSASLEDYDETDSWPSLIDDLVEW